MRVEPTRVEPPQIERAQLALTEATCLKFEASVLELGTLERLK
jgi:hypothetical protein